MAHKIPKYHHKSYSGKHKLQNPHKCLNKLPTINFRSLLERKFIIFCDLNPNVIRWGYELVHIPYISPIDNQIHKYITDFILQIKSSNGTIITYLVEIKPSSETKKPHIRRTKKARKLSKSFLREYTTYLINKSKWQAAQQYATHHNTVFRIITERDLKKWKKKNG